MKFSLNTKTGSTYEVDWSPTGTTVKKVGGQEYVGARFEMGSQLALFDGMGGEIIRTSPIVEVRMLEHA